MLYNQVRFVEPVSIRAVCTDSPGNLIPPALAPGAPVELGGTELAASGAPGGGAGVGGVFLPNAAGVNGAFADETIYEALALLAQSIPDLSSHANSGHPHGSQPVDRLCFE
eukprot:5187982-Amphidinium_carterae.1